jgi:GTP-binding protein
VYLKTSSYLTSLTSVKKRLIGGQGGNGAGNLRHGGRGEDVIVTVPVGTVVREVMREGEAEKFSNEAEAMGLDEEAQRDWTLEKVLVHHPTLSANEQDIREAEQHLKRMGRWMSYTPTFKQLPALELDIGAPLTEPVLLARGGAGGLGNPQFVSPNVRHPRLASRGVLPPTRTFEFELKLLADVGLVGLPNAGKSTLLRAMTGRRAEVADYAFTTLHPQIGVVRLLQEGGWAAAVAAPIEDTEVERAADVAAREDGAYQPLPRAERRRRALERTRFTVSDNPGLLAGASENIGLGHSFLRSIERSLALAYVLDARKPSPAADLRTLHAELEAYKPGLAGRSRVIALNKADDVPEDELEAKVAELQAELAELGGTAEVLVVSAKFGTGMERLVNILSDAVDAARSPKPQPPKIKESKRPAPELAPQEPPEPVDELF